MTPEELQALKNEVEELKYRLDRLDRADRFTFWKPLTSEGAGIRLGLAGEKLGFFNTNPIAQPATSATANVVVGAGAAVNINSASKGYTNAGTAYTTSDVVGALKALGMLAP